MRLVSLASLACASISVAMLAVGCGSESGADDGSGTTNGSGNGNGNGDPSAAFSGTASGDFDAGSLAACATSQAAASLRPVNLVFLYDKSGSMGDMTRWFTCSTGPTPVVQCNYFQVPVAPSPRYICYPQGAQSALAIDQAGSIYFNSKKCATGTVGGTAAVLCSDPSACTLADMFDPAKKWVPVGAAMNAFFADPKSAGTSASLGFFPLTDKDGATICSNTNYSTPAVALTALPNSSKFSAAISAQKPGGNTPTEVALQGAIAYAKTVAQAHPDDATAIVLVTDGEPTQCGVDGAQPISVVQGVAQAAATGTPSIKTYVIGVGDNLTNLNLIAQSGGTTKATLVSSTNPTQTATDFQNALDKIRGDAVSCNVALPKPPDGKTLDINAVNVVATIGGKEDVLTYNKDCNGGTGWHYDDANAPKEVQLCAGSCQAVRADAGGKLAITFGCATKGGVIR